MKKLSEHDFAEYLEEGEHFETDDKWHFAPTNDEPEDSASFIREAWSAEDDFEDD